MSLTGSSGRSAEPTPRLQLPAVRSGADDLLRNLTLLPVFWSRVFRTHGMQ